MANLKLKDANGNEQIYYNIETLKIPNENGGFEVFRLEPSQPSFSINSYWVNYIDNNLLKFYCDSMGYNSDDFQFQYLHPVYGAWYTMNLVSSDMGINCYDMVIDTYGGFHNNGNSITVRAITNSDMSEVWQSSIDIQGAPENTPSDIVVNNVSTYYSSVDMFQITVDVANAPEGFATDAYVYAYSPKNMERLACAFFEYEGDRYIYRLTLADDSINYFNLENGYINIQVEYNGNQLYNGDTFVENNPHYVSPAPMPNLWDCRASIYADDNMGDWHLSITFFTSKDFNRDDYAIRAYSGIQMEDYILNFQNMNEYAEAYEISYERNFGSNILNFWDFANQNYVDISILRNTDGQNDSYSFQLTENPFYNSTPNPPTTPDVWLDWLMNGIVYNLHWRDDWNVTKVRVLSQPDESGDTTWLEPMVGGTTVQFSANSVQYPIVVRLFNGEEQIYDNNELYLQGD